MKHPILDLHHVTATVDDAGEDLWEEANRRQIEAALSRERALAR
jgi:hypothetical protein